MAIKKIKVTNFKSFKKLEVELGDLNILIGANASGKSNFVDIFRFLWDIKNSGLENAISLQGGIEYLRNVNIGSSKELSLEITFDQRFHFNISRVSEILGWTPEIYETTYEFTIAFDESDVGFKITRDKLRWRFRTSESALRASESAKEEGNSGELVISNENGIVKIDHALPKDVLTERDNLLSRILVPEKLPPATPLLATPLYPMMIIDISIYDFDRGILRDAVSMAAKAELEGNGSNLAVVLKNIMNKADGKRKLLNLVDDALPFVDDLAIEKLADKFLLFKLKEKYSDQYLPGFLLSDGTISTIALIVALYFEKQPLAIIEEPERGIHPYLISEVIDMMRDASENKQIVATTHSPEMVRHANKRSEERRVGKECRSRWSP